MGFAAPEAGLAGIEALRARFIELNDNRAEDLLAWRATLTSAAGDPRPALVGIGETAHRICGVAGTLGFDELGRLAFAVDQATAPIRGRDAAAADPVAIWAAAAPLLDALLDRIDLGC